MLNTQLLALGRKAKAKELAKPENVDTSVTVLQGLEACTSLLDKGSIIAVKAKPYQAYNMPSLYQFGLLEQTRFRAFCFAYARAWFDAFGRVEQQRVFALAQALACEDLSDKISISGLLLCLRARLALSRPFDELEPAFETPTTAVNAVRKYIAFLKSEDKRYTDLKRQSALYKPYKP